MSDNGLVVEKKEQYAILTIDRPPVNALNAATVAALDKALDDLREDKAVRALVLIGGGDKIFSAGADVNEDLGGLEATKFWQDLGSKMAGYSKPIIAAFNGHALGGALEFALACHFRIMNEASYCCLAETNLGIFPGSGGTQRLPLLVGLSKALEYMIFATKIPADECLRVGLVDRLTKEGETLQEAEKMAQALAKRPPLAVKGILDCVNRGIGAYIEKGLEIECENYLVVMDSADHEEGLKAFSERREPNFKGE
jgi:enoyl-CoA hydratase/carnithine racemase